MRVSVIGSSGAGKSTFARELASKIDLPHLELDSIYHQANWNPLPDDEFRAQVAEFAAGERWVIDGNYAVVRPLVLDRATHVVWLDFSRPLIMTRVIWRSARRAIDRQELWNGNHESVRAWIDADHPIRWSWSTFARRRREYEERYASPEYAHLHVARLRRPREAEQYLRHCNPA